MPAGALPSMVCPHQPALGGPVLTMTAAAHAARPFVRVLRDQTTTKGMKMGLDMYALTLNRTPEAPVDFKAHDAVPIHYWRKHPNLHGWMEDLYREKGGSKEQFNCVPVVLTREDLDQLERVIKTNSLLHTTGFFFGESDGTESHDDLQFIGKAREAIAAGLTVFYWAWW
jgi:hypothetical protein